MIYVYDEEFIDNHKNLFQREAEAIKEIENEPDREEQKQDRQTSVKDRN